MFVFFFSGCTLFLNKYLIDLTDGDATLLSKATTYNRYFIVSIFLTTYLHLDYSNLLVHTLWQYRLWSFQTGCTKLERFLQKNQHTQKKLLNFENWTNGEPQ